MARAAHTAYLSLGAQTVCPNNGDHRAVCVRTSHERAGFRARFDFRDDLPPCVLPPPSRADGGWLTACFTPQSSSSTACVRGLRVPSALARCRRARSCRSSPRPSAVARGYAGIPSCTTPLILRADVHAMQEEFDALAPGEARCLTDVLPGSRAQDAAPSAFRSRRLVTLLDALLLQLGWHGEGP